MKNILNTWLCATLLVALAVVGVNAQERTAGGSLLQEASWTALQSLIDRNKSDILVLRADTDAIKKCNAQGKVYAPGEAGADEMGCIPVMANVSITVDTNSCVEFYHSESLNGNCGGKMVTHASADCSAYPGTVLVQTSTGLRFPSTCYPAKAKCCKLKME